MKTRYYQHAPIASQEPAFLVPFCRDLTRLKFPPERKYKRILIAYAISGTLALAIGAYLISK